MPGSSLDGLALFTERWGSSDPGIRHAYFLLEQQHEEQRMFAHSTAETDATSAAEWDLPLFRSAIQLVKVVIDLQRVPQVCVRIHPILNDKPLVLAHQWLQLHAKRWYRELARRIQSLE